MKIKALWGFFGDAEKLGVKDSKVRAGQEFSKVNPEYAHTLIGKGLAVDVTGQPKPAANKDAKPAGSKPAGPAGDKTAAASEIKDDAGQKEPEAGE